MTPIAIYGASDDLIEVEGGISDEFTKPIGPWHGVLAGPEYGAMGIVVEYTDLGTWSVGVYQLDEDHPLPPWPISIRQGTNAESIYSSVLVIDAPNDCTLAEVKP